MKARLAAVVFSVLPLCVFGNIQVVRLDKSPYNERVIIHRMYTERDVLGGRDNPLVMQVVDFPLGVFLASKPNGFRGLREYGTGSTILVWVYAPDGTQKRFYIYKQDAPPFVEPRTYFKENYRKAFTDSDGIPHGKVVVIAILVNSYGESIKAYNAQKTLVVDYGEKSGENSFVEGLDRPYLIYNEPYGTFRKGDPIILDFYVENVSLGRDAYSVEVFVDGKKEDTVYEWAPYKMIGFSSGRHEVEIVLRDPDGKVVKQPFGPQKNTIRVR